MRPSPRQGLCPAEEIDPEYRVDCSSWLDSGLLIVDEIGSLPIDRAGANFFFQLISRRYERGPMILTNNQGFGSWGDVFGDPVIATAILDRVLHHAITLNIRGNSYRLKDKLKAGLVKPVEATTT